jgi:hypothetical protein
LQDFSIEFGFDGVVRLNSSTLRRLKISSGRFSDVEWLGGMSRLVDLSLTFPKIESPLPYANLTGLQILWLQGFPGILLEGLSQLISLCDLSLVDCMDDLRLVPGIPAGIDSLFLRQQKDL